LHKNGEVKISTLLEILLNVFQHDAVLREVEGFMVNAISGSS
jgi:hypothetical protein